MSKLPVAVLILLGSLLFVWLLPSFRPINVTPKPSGPPIGTLSFDVIDPKKGVLSGTYEYKGYSISFRAIRGGRNPFPETLDPQTPRFATDALLCDMQHFCFGIQAGGDTFTHEELLADQHPELVDEERAFSNQQTAWALHHDLQLIDRSHFAGLEEQLDSLIGLSHVPDPSTHQLPKTSNPPYEN